MKLQRERLRLQKDRFVEICLVEGIVLQKDNCGKASLRKPICGIVHAGAKLRNRVAGEEIFGQESKFRVF